MKPILLVLAAGMGSRYGGLKQIDPIGPGGETIIDYSVYDAAKAGFAKVVFIIRRDIEKDFREFIGDKYQNLIEVDYAFQEIDDLPAGFQMPSSRVKPWGTTHAVLCARKKIDRNFLVINGDDFYGRGAFQTAAQWLDGHDDSKRAQYLLVAYELQNTLSEHGTVSRGICVVSAKGELQDIVERTAIGRENGIIGQREADGRMVSFTGREATSMNMFGFTPALFPQIEEKFRLFMQQNSSNAKSECYIPTSVGQLVKEGRASVQIIQTSENWFGVTYREDRANVLKSINDLIKAKVYPQQLFQ